MKKVLLTLSAAFLLAIGANAQTSYGVKAGVNFPKISVSADGASISTKASTSFYLTGFVDAPIATNLSIQPGISLQGKGGKTSDEDGAGKMDLMYIEVPVNLVYYVPAGSGNVFFGAGPYAGFGISAKLKQGDESESGSFEDAGLKTFDAGLNFLAGYKLANGFLINGGYGLGLTNIAKDFDEFGSFKNKVFSVGVGFQF